VIPTPLAGLMEGHCSQGKWSRTPPPPKEKPGYRPEMASQSASSLTALLGSSNHQTETFMNTTEHSGH